MPDIADRQIWRVSGEAFGKPFTHYILVLDASVEPVKACACDADGKPLTAVTGSMKRGRFTAENGFVLVGMGP